MRSPALLLATLAALTLAGCSADRSPLPTKPGASLDALTRSPIDPMTHDGPVSFNPDTKYATFTVRAPKHKRFPRNAFVALGYDRPDGGYSAQTISPYGHLELGRGFSDYNGHECCGGPFAARVKPNEVQIWFPGIVGGGTMRVFVGGQFFDVPVPETFPEERIQGLHECVVLWDEPWGLVLPCGVEPE